MDAFTLILELLLFLFECLGEGAISAWLFETDLLSDVQKGRTLGIILALFGGGLVGVLTLMVLPKALLTFEELRVANLVVAPLTAIAGVYAMPVRPKRHRYDSRFWTAMHAGCFTFGLVMVRFAACR